MLGWLAMLALVGCAGPAHRAPLSSSTAVAAMPGSCTSYATFESQRLCVLAVEYCACVNDSCSEASIDRYLFDLRAWARQHPAEAEARPSAQVQIDRARLRTHIAGCPGHPRGPR